MSETPKQKFVEYVKSLELEADENETYETLEKRVADKFKIDETPLQLEPMLAVDATMAPEQYWNNPNYICEEKLDGIRMLMHFFRGEIRLTTRGKSPKTFLFNERTNNYPQYQKCYRESLEGTMLDGEMLGGKNDNRQSIAAIQAINGALPEQAIATQEKFGWARYRVFDVVRFNGQSLTDWEWKDRRTILEVVCMKIGLVPTVVHSENKKEFFDKICATGKEGIMLKHKESKYKPNSRENFWLKVKRYDELEAMIVGWSPGAGRHTGKVGACTVELNGKVVGAFGNMTDSLRKKMTDHRDGSLKKKYYGRKVLVRYQPPLMVNGRMRHARFIKFVEEETRYDKE